VDCVDVETTRLKGTLCPSRPLITATVHASAEFVIVPGQKGGRFSLEVGQAHCVACITDLIVKKDLINLDFADVRAAMRAMGKAMMEPERLPATRARISAFGPSASKFLAGRHVNVPIGRVD
jgi:hypothetical protein